MSADQSILFFIKELEHLKINTRTAWTSTGRQESIADHSWRLGMFVLALEDYFPNIDINRVIRMCLVHDIGEAYEGDVSAKIQEEAIIKLTREEQAVSQLFEPLPDNLKKKLVSLWQEYNEGVSQEAKLAKALDKMETIIQHNQGSNPDHFDYAFNLSYGREYAQFDEFVRSLREMIDQETRSRL